MIYTSDVPVKDIAEDFGFADGEAMTRTVEQWARRSIEEPDGDSSP